MSSVTDPARSASGGRQPLAERTSATADQLRDWLRQMLLIREFEVRTMQAYQDKKIGGFCHIYIGQEAVAVGCTAAVRHGDPIITAYRDHGHALARGMDPKYCMAEMYGRIGGCAKGRAVRGTCLTGPTTCLVGTASLVRRHRLVQAWRLLGSTPPK